MEKDRTDRTDKTDKTDKTENITHSNLFNKILQAREAAGIHTPIISTLSSEEKRIIEDMAPGEVRTVNGHTYVKE